MADPTDEDDDADLVPIKRQPKMLGPRKSLPSVDGALDDFIVSANQKLLDVKEFTAENREQQLRDEVAELGKKLAAAEARLDKQATAPAMETPSAPPAKRSWGMIIGAFVLGGGLAFGAARLMQPSTSSSVAARECEPAHEQVAAPVVSEQPAVAIAPPSTPPPSTPPPSTPPTVAAKQAPKQSQTKTAQKTSTAADPHHEPAAVKDPPRPDTKAPPAQDGSGSDLYNPF